ncbi:hypothetical protein Q0Z83_042760 [Actinoplanes sichuanensis]|nr:hypothetical protein [Actinoplanes sichuanensis]BEL06085.1 hypothetical protein Q0Z83_042760 [Actinoplanes sichuanensis]
MNPYPRLAAVSAVVVGLITAVSPAAAAAEPDQPLSTEQVVALALTAVTCQPDGPTTQDSQLAATLNTRLNNSPRLGDTVTAYQVSCARAIVAAVRARKLNERAAVIALTTAITETTLHNWDGGDDDSVGLFQQRPSQGWGDPADLVKPAYATSKFLGSMLDKYPDNAWNSGDIGTICQRVQVSAYPDAYSLEVNNATIIADALWADETVRSATTGDYNNDGQTDRAFYRPSDGKWYIQYYRTNGVAIYPQLNAAAGDIPVPGDYNGDGQFDRAVWNPNGEWKITYYGSNGTAIYRDWGQAGDIPTPGDYNNDGQYDRAFYRPSDGKWYIQYYRTNGVAIYPQLNAAAGDIPVPGDYNGDGQFDRAVWNPNGEWKITYYGSNGTAIYRDWGQAGDIPTPGDYNNDGQYDRALYRPSDGKWYIQYYRTNGVAIYPQLNAAAGDIPVPGDYNGDGQFDRAVWNPNGEWKITYYGSNGTAIYRSWGQTGDIPVTQ